MLPREIEFWSEQLMEHALFLHLGLEDYHLKAEGADQHARWVAYREGLEFGPPDVDLLLGLCRELRAYKTEILDRLNRGEWLGWIYPLFVDHTRRELDLFVSHVTNQSPPKDRELSEWLRFMAEHAAFADHLLDPTEANLSSEARDLVVRFDKLYTQCGSGDCMKILPQLVELSNRAGTDLDAYFKGSGLGTPKTKSIVHPVLAAHVVREGNRFLETLRSL